MTLEAIAAGRVYRLVATPISTAKTCDASIVIETDSPGTRQREFRVWLMVQ